MSIISKWYCDQTILVTGGTGFMGKVLLEKLLRSCSGLNCLYVIIRSKGDLDPTARIEEMLKLPLFEKVMKENPEVIKKLVAIEGDVSKPGLGLSEDKMKLLISEVTIVFNVAATVHMDSLLKTAIKTNTTSTKNVLDLCTEMKHLKAFVHLSTAFCHCELDILEEKVYPPPHDPHDIMHAIEWMDDKTIELISPSLLGHQPNAYAYSKRLSEYLVYEYRDKFPVCIARPSIVIPTYEEPIPGWVDTLNGPIGIMAGAAKGVIRTMMCHPDYYAEVIPVDNAINVLIIMAWSLENIKSPEVPVYNISLGSVIKIKWPEILERSRKVVYKYPFEKMIWYPDGNIRTNWIVHYFCVIFFHFLPAYFIDFLCLLFRKKRFMVRLQYRINTGLKMLQYFTLRDWKFNDDKLYEVLNILPKEDRKVFYTDNIVYDKDKYILHTVLGLRVYCMKEPLSSLPKSRRLLFIFYCLHIIARILFFGLFIWLFFKYVDTARFVLEYSTSMLQTVPMFNGFFL